MDLGAIPPHESDPSRKPLPQEKVKVEKDYHDLTELTPPHGSRESRRLYHLLQSPTPERLAEVRDILYSTESRPVLTFIGDQLGKVLTPHHVPLARDLLRLKELPSTDAFLRSLARRELDGVRRGLSAALAGDEMVPLRVELGKLSVAPEIFFSRNTLDSHAGYIEKLLLFPIVILRRCSSREAPPLFVNAATKGSIDADVSRRALEALTHVEAADPLRRVISGEFVAAIAATMDSFFRNSLNRMDTFAFIDRWLKKPSDNPATDSAAVRDIMHGFWREYRRGSSDPIDTRGINIMDVMALMRHFDDSTSIGIVEEACDDRNAGISIMAHLCRFGRSAGVLTRFAEALNRNAPREDRQSASRVFSYSLSSDIDTMLLPFFLQMVRREFRAESEMEAGEQNIERIRMVLVAGLARRLYTCPIDASFVVSVFHEALSRNDEEASLVASTLLGMARQRRVMPLSFYDEPKLLATIGACIERMRLSATANRPAMVSIADEIEGHFILDGPARFGFQLTRSRETSSGAAHD